MKDESDNSTVIRLAMQCEEGICSGQHPWGVELEDAESRQGEGDEGENPVDDEGDNGDDREDREDGINGIVCLLAHDRQSDYTTNCKLLVLFYESSTQILLSWEPR